MSIQCHLILDPIKRKVLNRGLRDLKGLYHGELLEYYKELEEIRKTLQTRCINEIPSELYRYFEASITLAFLKVCVALEETGYPHDELGKLGYCRFTSDEKNALRGLEKYFILRDVSIDNIVEYIVAEKGTVFTLVKEALREGYINFVELMEVWRNNLDIRESLIIAFQSVYREIFDNIKEAFIKLIEKRPAWLNRVFKEYEDMLLDSAEVREKFEKIYREAFQNRLREMEEKFEFLERERSSLLETIRMLSEKIEKEVSSKEMLLKELENIRTRYEDVRRRYEELLSEWNKKVEEVNKLAEELKNKEEQLSKIAERERELSAAREALEAEVARLKSLREDYEKKIRILEEELSLKATEINSLREKLEGLQNALQGRVEGNFVSYEDIESILVIHAGRFRDKIEQIRELVTPWGRIDVDKWTDRAITPHIQNGYAIRIGFARLVKGGIFSRRRSIEINLVYYIRHDKLKSLGYDNEALSLSEFLNIIREYVEEALHDDSKFIVIGIVSPTGYSEKVVSYVTGKEIGKSLILSNLVVILVDPIKNTIYYPDTSRYAKDYVWLFRLEAPEEEKIGIAKVLKELHDEALIKTGQGYAPLTEFHSRAKTYPLIARLRVLNKLMECGDIEIKKIDRNPYILFKRVPTQWCIH
ncbi:hypothetical protein Igag_0818 [Ignisphaera aggregans DSM 17230]|uniref:Uncharacterized protein n=1 Tax=Ignisphaera aggregans (strain DSM 17230 / JCM 13409 / AQ1.S1) TaxID=583356 RepID=E0STM5_IGNAA|nr:hypothetical protein Igag_0818 [Ignisphaera aggregans DSM 17230]